MITAKYRSDYPGEFVVLKTLYQNGKKQQEREWIENPIENRHISKRAAIIGSFCDTEQFDCTVLQGHRGGLLGTKSLQLYSSGDLWKKMKFDFLIATQRDQIDDILQNNYHNNNVVYSNVRMCIENPGHLFLVPYNPPMDQLALAVYLSAFDGHREIFLLGYNQETPGSKSRVWFEHVNYVFKAYQSVQFYLVGTASNMYPLWKKNRNVSTMDYRKFISYCDV